MKRVLAGCAAAWAMFSGGAAAAEVNPFALIQADTNDIGSLRTNGSGDELDAGSAVTRIRRATVGLEGEAGDSLAWEVGYDLRHRTFRDVYATLTVGDTHSITAGQFKQPVLMDELSSSRTADFIASSTIADVFAVSRRVGVAYQHRAGHAGAVAAVFGRELGNGGNEGRGAALRAFGTPIRWEDGFVHLGASYASTRSPGPVEYRIRPNADLLSLRLVEASTASPCAQCDSRVAILGAPEVALVRGPWKFQSEMARARARQYAADDAGTASTLDAQGGYASLLWMPGKYRWSYRDGLIATPRPAEGAFLWQLGLRYDWIDLEPDARSGSGESSLRLGTAGVNWYAGPRWKLSVNVVDARARKHAADMASTTVHSTIFESRVQFAW